MRRSRRPDSIRKTRASRSHPRTTRVSRVIRSQCTPANALGLPSVLLRLSVGGCILFCGSLYPRDVYYLKFTARKREAHLSRFGITKRARQFHGTAGQFRKRHLGLPLRHRETLYITSGLGESLRCLPSSSSSPRLRTTLAMSCAAAPRYPRCGRHFPVTFRASGLSGIAFSAWGAAWRDPKKPPSNASTAKSRGAGCRHPLSASCYPNHAKGTKSLHNMPRFVVSPRLRCRAHREAKSEMSLVFNMEPSR